MTNELVLYFSVYGTAKIVAEEIAKQTGADIREIIPEIPYDGNRDHYSALLGVAQKEHDTDARPAIKEKLPIEEYDRIYIGYPIWVPGMAALIRPYANWRRRQRYWKGCRWK